MWASVVIFNASENEEIKGEVLRDWDKLQSRERERRIEGKWQLGGQVPKKLLCSHNKGTAESSTVKIKATRRGWFYFWDSKNWLFQICTETEHTWIFHKGIFWIYSLLECNVWQIFTERFEKCNILFLEIRFSFLIFLFSFL